MLAAVLLVFALRNVAWSAIRQAFGQANYQWVGVVALSTLGTYLIRGKRTQQSLMPLGHRPSTFHSSVALMSGNIMSMVVPGAGEITRCLTLHRTDDIPVSHAMGAVVAERIIDVLMLGLVIALTFLLEAHRFMSMGLLLTLPGSTAIVWLAGLGGLLLILIWIVMQRWGGRWQQHPIVVRSRAGWTGLWQGILAIRALPNPRLFAALAVANQLLYALSTYSALQALPNGHHLPPTAALLVLTVSSLGGLAVPTQGGIGTYHFLVGNALMLYGFSQSEGMVMATFMHAVGFAINVVLSGMSFIIIPFLIAKQPKEVV